MGRAQGVTSHLHCLLLWCGDVMSCYLSFGGFCRVLLLLWRRGLYVLLSVPMWLLSSRRAVVLNGVRPQSS